ncbi:hypothetical protein [Mycobacterium sp. C31M]
MSRSPDPYEKLPQRLRDEIDAVDPSTFAKLDKYGIVEFLQDRGLPVTLWAVREAIGNRSLPTKKIGKALRASEFDVLVWAATRDLNARASA